jgi:hypothetical protein
LEINEEVFKNQILKGMTVKQLQEYYNCSRSKIYYYKKKYSLIGISPNSRPRDVSKELKTCRRCGKEKTLGDFYSNGYYKEKKKYKPNCKVCESVCVYSEYIAKIKHILEALGKEYKCSSCGYSANHSALCFHHNNKEKNFIISEGKTFSYNKLYNEIALCTLLCQNCHHELHNPQANNT